MPKRRNPFDDCSPLQMKIHVGRKEVDMGVAREENMKAVYERTKQLLFSGSKKSFSDTVPTDANQNNIMPLTNGHHCRQDIDMEDDSSNSSGQMHITSSGQLTTEPPLSTVENAGPSSKPKTAWAALFQQNNKGNTNSSCQCCKGQAASQDRCGFCEKSICNGCVRQCYACDGIFCQFCSVMNYEDINEHPFCLNCSS